MSLEDKRTKQNGRQNTGSQVSSGMVAPALPNVLRAGLASRRRS